MAGEGSKTGHGLWGVYGQRTPPRSIASDSQGPRGEGRSERAAWGLLSPGPAQQYLGVHYLAGMR